MGWKRDATKCKLLMFCTRVFSVPFYEAIKQPQLCSKKSGKYPTTKKRHSQKKENPANATCLAGNYTGGSSVWTPWLFASNKAINGWKSELCVKSMKAPNAAVETIRTPPVYCFTWQIYTHLMPLILPAKNQFVEEIFVSYFPEIAATRQKQECGHGHGGCRFGFGFGFIHFVPCTLDPYDS